MARRKKRKQSRSSKVAQGKKILANEFDDQVVAFSLGSIFNESQDVLDATDLNESFKYFEKKHMKGNNHE